MDLSLYLYYKQHNIYKAKKRKIIPYLINLNRIKMILFKNTNSNQKTYYF